MARGVIRRQGRPLIDVREYDGARRDLRRLFELAEDSARQLDAYIDAGRVLVAVDADVAIGHVQLIDGEIKSVAVDPAHQRRGIGRALVEAAITMARGDGASTLVVATASADVGNLRFYQRLGFRMRSIERDAFTPATGYEDGIEIGGIPLRDRVWLDLELSGARGSPR